DVLIRAVAVVFAVFVALSASAMAAEPGVTISGEKAISVDVTDGSGEISFIAVNSGATPMSVTWNVALEPGDEGTRSVSFDPKTSDLPPGPTTVKLTFTNPVGTGNMEGLLIGSSN